MKTKKILECDVIHCEPALDSTPQKLRFDVVVKQVEIKKYKDNPEIKKNIFAQYKSRIRLEKGQQILTLEEGVNNENGKTWIAVVETTKSTK